jgi:hypothetical protein
MLRWEQTTKMKLSTNLDLGLQRARTRGVTGARARSEREFDEQLVVEVTPMSVYGSFRV